MKSVATFHVIPEDTTSVEDGCGLRLICSRSRKLVNFSSNEADAYKSHIEDTFKFIVGRALLLLVASLC